MASGIARLASGQGLLAMASWVARLASDEGLLRRGELLGSPRRAMNRQTTGSAKNSQKVTNFTMLNLKTIRNINPVIVLGSVRNFYIKTTLLHQQFTNSSLLT